MIFSSGRSLLSCHGHSSVVLCPGLRPQLNQPSAPSPRSQLGLVASIHKLSYLFKIVVKLSTGRARVGSLSFIQWRTYHLVNNGSSANKVFCSDVKSTASECQQKQSRMPFDFRMEDGTEILSYGLPSSLNKLAKQHIVKICLIFWAQGRDIGAGGGGGGDVLLEVYFSVHVQIHKTKVQIRRIIKLATFLGIIDPNT